MTPRPYPRWSVRRSLDPRCGSRALALLAALLLTAACSPIPAAQPQSDAPLRVTAGTSATLTLTTADTPSGAAFRIEQTPANLDVEVQRTTATTASVTVTAQLDAPPSSDTFVIAVFADAEATRPGHRYQVDVEVLGRYILKGTLLRDDLTAERALGRSIDDEAEDEYVVLIDDAGTILADDTVDAGDGTFQIEMSLDAATLASTPNVALLRARDPHPTEASEAGIDYVCIEPIGIAESEVDADGRIRTRRVRPILLDYRSGPRAAPSNAFDDEQWPRVLDLGPVRSNDLDGSMSVHDREIAALTVDPPEDSPFLDDDGAFNPALLACGSTVRTIVTDRLLMQLDVSSTIVENPFEDTDASWIPSVTDALTSTLLTSALVLDLTGDIDDAAHATTAIQANVVSVSDAGITRLAAPVTIDKPLAVADPSGDDDLIAFEPILTDSCLTHPSTCDFDGGVTPVLDLSDLVDRSVGQPTGDVPTVTFNVVTLIGRAYENGVRFTDPEGRGNHVHASCNDGQYAIGRTDSTGAFAMRLFVDPTRAVLSCTFDLDSGATLDRATRRLPTSPGIIVLEDLRGWR